MTPREERGLVIAATQKLTQKGKVWLVPSQAGKGKYTVCPDEDCPYCSCPDHEDTGQPCKHIFAVRTVMKRETNKDGSVTETRSVTFTQKKTYSQNWPLYSLAQIEEKKRFTVLLADLCKGVPDAPQNKSGRRRTEMADMIFTRALKVYSTFSCRRFGTDFKEAQAKGYIPDTLHPMMACAFLERPMLTPVLKELIERSAQPLRAVETTFAPDSTGFSTSRFVRWFDEKYGKERSGRQWVKLHAICGVKTHIITAVQILDKDAADCPQFETLVKTTATNGFTVKEVPADKAYLSHENLALVESLGGTAYIPFKSNSVAGEPGTLWEKMYHYYQLRREEFEQHYHQRSNCESAFSMAKAKFKDSVRSRTETAMVNEVLCKILCHNICCLIMSQLELGIEPVFWGETTVKAAESEPTPEPTTIQPTEIKTVDPMPAERPAVQPMHRMMFAGA